jgi:hypothetical protein
MTMLIDIPTLMAAATPSERRAVVGALFDKVWIQEKGIVAVTPRADVGPVLAGLAKLQHGCLDGVPDGHQCPAFRYAHGSVADLDGAPSCIPAVKLVSGDDSIVSLINQHCSAVLSAASPATLGQLRASAALSMSPLSV